MPICTRCHEPKSLDEFAYKNRAKGRRHSHCKACQKPVSSQHYQENKPDYIDRAHQRYEANRAENGPLVQAYLATHPCSCGCADPQVLGFICENPKEHVMRLLGQSWEIVAAAIANSKVICLNCRKRTGLAK